jgi:hypothetical protein
LATTNKNFRVRNGLEVGNAIGVGVNGISFGTAGQVLSSNGTANPAIWIDNYSTATKHQVKLAESINKGQAVYVSSATGSNMLVSKASNATETTSSKTMGLLDQSGTTNDFVNIVTEGLVTGTGSDPLDTSAANAEGDPVWLGTDGNLIYGANNAPKAPNHLVFLGIVTRKSATVGEIFVRVQNGFETSELHDVYINGLSNGQVLYRANVNGSNSLWTNGSLADANIASATHSHGNITSSGTLGSTGGLVLGTTSGGGIVTFTAANSTSNTTEFLRGDGTWAVPPGGSTYTNGAGLSLSGTTFSLSSNIAVTNVNATNVFSTTVNATTVNATANVIAGKYYGDGSTMSNVGVITSSTPPSVTSVLWVDTSSNASTTIPSSTFTTKGDLLTASANNTPVRLGVGTDGMSLVSNSSATYGVAWQYPYRGAPYRPGYYYDTMQIGLSTFNLNATYLYFYPVHIGYPLTLTGLTVYVSSSNATNTPRLGIYKDNGSGSPGDLLLDAGTYSMSTTGQKTVTVANLTMSPGIYWFCHWGTGNGGIYVYQDTTNGSTANPMLGVVTPVWSTTTNQALTYRISSTYTPGTTVYPSTFPALSWTETTSAPRILIKT